MIITPYSALDTEAQVAPTRAKFPRVKNFWKHEEATGAAAIVDSIEGIGITAPVTRSADGFGLNTTSGVKTTTGTFLAPGATSALMFFAVSKHTTSTAAPHIGIATTAQFMLADGAGPGVKYVDIATSICGGADITKVTAGNIKGRAVAITFPPSTNTGYSYELDVTADDAPVVGAQFATNETSTGGISVTANTTMTTGASGANHGATIDTYGWAIFEFTSGTLPADIKAALYWMAKQWALGNKVIYPGWKGLS